MFRTFVFVAVVVMTVANSQPQSIAPGTDQYRIGPHDVLSIRVTAGRPVPELSMAANAARWPFPILKVMRKAVSSLRMAMPAMATPAQ